MISAVAVAILATQAPAAVTLRMSFTKGAKYEYTLKTLSRTAETALPANTPIKVEVLDVVDGIATIAYTYGPTVVGVAKPEPAKSGIGKIDRRGRIVEGNAIELQSVLPMELPEKPLKVGDTWEATEDMNLFVGSTSVRTVYKLESIKVENGRTMATIRFTMQGRGSLDVRGAGSVRIRTRDGFLAHTYSALNASTLVGQREVKVTAETEVTMTKEP